VGRKRREFTRAEIDDLVALFDEGHTTERIGELRGLSGSMVRRVLHAEFGSDLRTARRTRQVRARRDLVRASQRPADVIAQQLGEQPTTKEYREGFEAGVRQALTWAGLHGLEAVRKHCNEVLLVWRDTGRCGPPGL